MPVFDKKGRIVDSDKPNADDDWPTLKDLDEIAESDRKKPLSLLDKIPRTFIVLALIIIVLLIAIAILAERVDTLNNKITVLLYEKEEIEATQTKLQETNAEKEKLGEELSLAKNNLKAAKAQRNELHARRQKLEEAAKRKPQPAATSKKPIEQKKGQGRSDLFLH
jgi:hypothetical protein